MQSCSGRESRLILATFARAAVTISDCEMRVSSSPPPPSLSLSLSLFYR